MMNGICLVDVLLCRPFRPQFMWDQLFPGLATWANL